MNMTLIYETKNFIVEAPDKPHVSRKDGGHIKIKPKTRYVDRQALSPKEAVELMRLTIVVGEAMTEVLRKNGVDIGRINYQDNGNWSVFKPKGPYLHVHLYGRATNAEIQKYGDALNFPHRDTGFYDDNEPLLEADINEIKEYIIELLNQDRYKIEQWGL